MITTDKAKSGLSIRSDHAILVVSFVYVDITQLPNWHSNLRKCQFPRLLKKTTRIVYKKGLNPSITTNYAITLAPILYYI